MRRTIAKRLHRSRDNSSEGDEDFCSLERATPVALRFISATGVARSSESEQASAVLRPRVGRRFGAFGHAVVAHDGGDTQTVVAQHAAASGGLRLAVMLDIAPGLYRLLVAPEGEREQLLVVDQALEALDADEAVDPLELGLQAGGDVEVGLLAAIGGPHLEDDGGHSGGSFLTRQYATA